MLWVGLQRASVAYTTFTPFNTLWLVMCKVYTDVGVMK